MYKHIQWTRFFFLRKKEGFGLYARQPRKNLHTGISVNKPKLPVTKHDQTLILAHMYDTSRYTANTKMYSGILHTHTQVERRGINYKHIWRDEFLRLAWKKMLMLSDEHHMVMSSTVLGPWKKKLIVQRSLFLWKVCRRFWCQKWSELVWMDGRHAVKSSER